MKAQNEMTPLALGSAMQIVKALAPLVFFTVLSCSSPEKPEQLMRRLMESKIQGGKFDENHTDSTATLFSSKADDEQSIEGNQRIQKDYLIVTLHESMLMENWYWTGVFRNEGGTWKSLFDSELIKGKLEKIIDLNGDGTDELIIDEYEGNSSGYDSYQFLYAIKDKPYLEKIANLGRNLFPGNAYSGTRTQITYKDNGTKTVLLTNTNEFNTDSEGKTSGFETNHIYRWQPPELIDVSTAAANTASSITFDGFLAEAQRCRTIMEKNEPGEGLPSLEFALDLPHLGFERTLLAVHNALEDIVCVSLYTSEEGSNHYYLVAWKKNQQAPQIMEVGETNYGGSDEKWNTCKIEPLRTCSDCPVTSWQVTCSHGEGKSYEYSTRVFSLADGDIVEALEKADGDFQRGNFAIVFNENSEPSWDPYFLTGGIEGGNSVLIFNTDNQIFGRSTGFDLDSYLFNGKYRIVSHTKDSEQSVYRIIISGETLKTIEGQAEPERNQFSDKEFQLLWKNKKGLLTILSPDLFFGQRLEDGVVVIRENLSPEEVNQAKASIIK